MRGDWFTLAFCSPSIFHQVLANSALHYNHLRQPGKCFEASATSTHFHQLALSDVRSQLAQPDVRVDDGLLAVVAGMLCWAARYEAAEQCMDFANQF